MKRSKKKRVYYTAAVVLCVVIAVVLINNAFFGVDDATDGETTSQDGDMTPKYPILEPNVGVGTDGVVAAVETSSGDSGEVLLITLQTEVNSFYRVTVPLDHVVACEAGNAIADVRVITPGDKIAIRGTTDSSGRIVPCESEHHSLTIHGVYHNADAGLSFNYKKGPGGFVLVNDEYEFSTSSQFVTGALLLSSRDTVSERSPITMLRVYRNPDLMESEEWARANPSETFIHRIGIEPAEISVGGEDAIGFTLQGPFLMDVYVVAYSEYILVINGEYEEYDSPPFHDIGELVDTIAFKK